MIHTLAYVVIFCLLFSLVESKLILPSFGMAATTKGQQGPDYRIRGWLVKGLRRE